MADSPLLRIQLIGARLAMMQQKARIMLRASGSLGHLLFVKCGRVSLISRPMCSARMSAGSLIRLSYGSGFYRLSPRRAHAETDFGPFRSI